MIQAAITSLLLISAATSVTLALIIFFTKQKKPVSLWLGVVAVFSAAWTMGITFFLNVEDGRLATLFAHIYYIAALLIPYSLYFFSLYYPYTRIQTFAEPLAYTIMVALVSVVISVPGVLIESVNVGPEAQNTVSLNLWTYSAYALLFTALALKAFSNLIQSYHRTKSQNEPILARQIYGIIVICAVSMAGGSIFDLFLPLLGNYYMIWIGPLFVAVFSMYVFIVLVKQGLVDLRMAVARMMVYSSLIAIILVLYLVILVAVDRFIFPETELEPGQQIFYLLCAVLLAMTVRPIHAYLERFIHIIFYSRRNYTLHDTVEKISSIAANEIELSVMVRNSLKVISDALQPEYASLYVLSSSGKIYHYGVSRLTKNRKRLYQRQMDSLEEIIEDLPQITRANDISQLQSSRIIKKVGASLIVRLSVRDDHVGVLFLGERVNGLPYDDGDMHLVNLISDELAVSIQNGLRFEEIQQFNKRLRTEVSRATRQLKRSNKQLQRLDEVKDEFLSIASHQLRTPLTSVNGYLSMILDGDAGDITPQQRKLIEEAFVSSQHMVRLIEDFLNVSRIQTGRFAIERRPASLYDLISREVELLRVLSVGRKLEIVLKEEGELPPKVMIDEAKLRQVIMNFIDNAVYYSQPNSEIIVTIKQEKNQVKFTVEDSGMGVPKDDQDQLFTKFYRAPNARSRRPDGTGVGLYLAKKVILAHGGDIIFKSKEGKGSIFGFTIPMSELEIPESEAEGDTSEDKSSK